ncbi:MAG: DUF3231 family protein [Bacillota bacterium]|nr:DUF3231 family protein [Bacillota bacterium]
MVQIGNYHIGKAENAKKPVLDCGEAFALWDQLVSRYNIIEQTQLYLNFVHDPEFKYVLRKGLAEALEKQVNTLEEEMNRYEMPLPHRPPKSVNIPVSGTLMEDRFLFAQVFTGIQGFLDSHIRTIRSVVTNDPLRAVFIRFAKEELDIFNDLCKYGKIKGWLEQPPIYQMQ